MKKSVMRKWRVLLVSLLVVYIAAFAGSLFTSKNVSTSWYDSIRNPLIPPNWVFPVVWNVLFFLIALSLFFALINAKKKYKLKIALAFGINLLLNVFWSVLFFGFKKVNLAFFELILLWLSIIGMIYVTSRVSKKSALFLVPYLLWVGFAGILNYSIAFG